MQRSELPISELLEKDPELALKMLYSSYYGIVYTKIYRMLRDRTQSEDLAQEVFVEIWSRRASIKFDVSIGGYLKQTARNKTLNYIRSQKIKFENEEVLLKVKSDGISTQLILESEDLAALLNKEIDQLPERCKIIFALSRYENQSYRMIADTLSISIKTVENQISKALKILRNRLLEYQSQHQD